VWRELLNIQAVNLVQARLRMPRKAAYAK